MGGVDEGVPGFFWKGCGGETKGWWIGCFNIVADYIVCVNLTSLSLQATCISSPNTETKIATTAGYLRLDLLCSILCHDVARTQKIIFWKCHIDLQMKCYESN